MNRMVKRVGFIINTRKNGNVSCRIMKIKKALEKTYKNINIDVIYNYEDDSISKLKKLLSTTIRRYDVIHIFEPSWPSTLFLLFFKIMHIKIVYLSGDLHFSTGDLSGSKSFNYYYMKFVERFHYFFADSIIVGSLGLKDFLVNVWKIPEEGVKRILVFTISCHDQLSYYEQSFKRKSAQDYSTEFVIAYSASLRLMTFNGIKVSRGWEIPSIVKKLLEDGFTQIKADVLGDGPGLKYLMSQSHKLGVSDKISFRGALSTNDYLSALSNSDLCFVESLNHLSYRVMDPTKISDYLTAKKPFIVGRSLETDQWVDYQLVVEPQSIISFCDMEIENYIDEIVAKIEKFISDEMFRERCYASIDKIISSSPTWEDVAMDIHGIYERFD